MKMETLLPFLPFTISVASYFLPSSFPPCKYPSLPSGPALASH